MDAETREVCAVGAMAVSAVGKCALEAFVTRRDGNVLMRVSPRPGPQVQQLFRHYNVNVARDTGCDRTSAKVKILPLLRCIGCVI